MHGLPKVSSHGVMLHCIPLLPIFSCFSCRLWLHLCYKQRTKSVLCCWPPMTWHVLPSHTSSSFSPKKTRMKTPKLPVGKRYCETHTVSQVLPRYCLDNAKWHKAKHWQGAWQLLKNIDVGGLMFLLAPWPWLFWLFTRIDLIPGAGTSFYCCWLNNVSPTGSLLLTKALWNGGNSILLL